MYMRKNFIVTDNLNSSLFKIDLSPSLHKVTLYVHTTVFLNGMLPVQRGCVLAGLVWFDCVRERRDLLAEQNSEIKRPGEIYQIKMFNHNLKKKKYYLNFTLII